MENIDLSVIQKCKDGDTESFREIVTFYKDYVFSILYRMLGSRYKDDIEDMAQEIFIKIYDFVKVFDVKRNVKFSTCIYTIVKNYCLNEIKRKKLKLVPLENAMLSAKNNVDNELSRKIEDSVQQLPKDQRMVFIMREYEGLSYDEIAEVMKAPAGTIKSRISRAKETLQGLLADYIGE